jgi:hypothetical protein
MVEADAMAGDADFVSLLSDQEFGQVHQFLLSLDKVHYTIRKSQSVLTNSS